MNKSTYIERAAPIIAPFPPHDGKEWDCQCARCGSSCDSVDCWDCGGEGVTDHDCGDDTCCCLYPEDNVECDTCRGPGHWLQCMSSPEWCEANPLPGREGVERGKVEWFVDG